MTDWDAVLDKQRKLNWQLSKIKERLGAAVAVFILVILFFPGQIICHTWLFIPGQIIVTIGSVKVWKAAGMKRCPITTQQRDPECQRAVMARLKAILVLVLGVAVMIATALFYTYLDEHGHEMRCLSTPPTTAPVPPTAG